MGEEFNHRETIPYQLRDTVCKLYAALENGTEIRERANELLDELESEKIRNYIEGFGKASGGLGEKVKPKAYWLGTWVEVVKYKNKVLIGLQASKSLERAR